MKYPAIIAAATRAIISPSNASLLICRSPQPITTEPKIAITHPINANLEYFSLKIKYPPIRANNGCKQTITVELATEV